MTDRERFLFDLQVFISSYSKAEDAEINYCMKLLQPISELIVEHISQPRKEKDGETTPPLRIVD